MAGPLPDRAVTFGLGLFTGQRPPGVVQPPYRDALTLAAAAEEAGFDAFWVSEHHGWDDDYLPSPLTLLAAVSTATRRIALGAGVVLAPMHHPLRLAEDAAVVDQVSQGRLILGLGIGYVAEEYRAFGVDESLRGRDLDDKVAFLRAAWSGEPVTYDGATFAFDAVTVRPRPFSPEGIPIWLGGYAAAAIRRAGRVADGYLIGRGDMQIVEDATEVLRGVREPADPAFTVGVNVLAVLDGPGGAPAEARQGLTYQQRAYERRQRGRNTYSGRVAVTPTKQDLALGDVDAYLHARGDAQAVATALRATLASLSGWARVHLVLRILFPEPDVAAQVERVRAFGSQILPLVATAEA